MQNQASPLVPAPGLLTPAVAAALFCGYWLNRSRRRHLKRRIGRQALRNLYRTARNFAAMLGRGRCEVRGDLDRLRNGGIVYSFHFGAWELMPGILSRLGFRVGIIANRYAGQPHPLARLCDRLLLRFRTAPNVRVFYPGDGLKIARFLQAGGVFGALVDGDGRYDRLDGVRRLAGLSGLPLVPFAVYREADRAVLDLGCDLEKMMLERPYDYLWAYRSRRSAA